jgi:hypothetical protein
MSVNAYLPKNWRESECYKATRDAAGPSDSYFGHTVHDSESVPFIILKTIGGLPDDVPFVFFTMRTTFSVIPQRKRGMYRDESSEARLDSFVDRTQDAGLSYVLDIRADSYAKLMELHDKVRAGSIAPEIEYEGDQVASKPSEIEQRVARLEAMDADEIVHRVDAFACRVSEIVVRRITDVVKANSLPGLVKRGRSFILHKLDKAIMPKGYC